MTPREVAEFTELRATIRERGSLRIWLFFAILGAWAASTIATAALAALPIAALLPLLLLAGGFEAVFQLHTGVERIGRYLQVFYDNADGSLPAREWEHMAMAYGQAYSGGPDPLFARYFIVAIVLNFIPVVLAEPVRLEVAVVGAAHLLVAGHLLVARRTAARQRALDLERFQRIKQDAVETRH